MLDGTSNITHLNTLKGLSNQVDGRYLRRVNDVVSLEGPEYSLDAIKYKLNWLQGRLVGSVIYGLYSQLRHLSLDALVMMNTQVVQE